ncbi:hypothetical protein E2562_012894 [Oryza meyeriana var. granulata]|uniref:Uncharacterized protein n=1 Tax=Oryza meyeriana var. granulata TaxID=110450 RepID=A0A6G1CFY4_9ORYZ|nr:hypothetical protein E2562_012894 [Oryza meyeriana var. granulata]
MALGETKPGGYILRSSIATAALDFTLVRCMPLPSSSSSVKEDWRQEETDSRGTRHAHIKQGTTLRSGWGHEVAFLQDTDNPSVASMTRDDDNRQGGLPLTLFSQVYRAR